MPSILYIGQNPTEGTGSPIILLRHLRRFASDGWAVRLIAEFGENYAACRAAGWTIIELPRRKVWWPPYRDCIPFLRKLRMRLLAREIIKSQEKPPDVILSYLASHTEFYSDLAASYTRLSGRPLHVLVHDDAAAFPRAKNCARALRRRQNAALAPASVAWFVSPELAEEYIPIDSPRRRVILPIPDGQAKIAEWNGERTLLRIYYAGHIWPEQIPLLEECATAISKAGGKLIVLAKPCLLLEAASKRKLIEIMPLFQRNTEALEHLRRHASAVLVSYANDTLSMPWSITSFPSKLIEFAHLGVPIAIVAPIDTSVQRWTIRIGFKPTFLPKEMHALQIWIAALRFERCWKERSIAALNIAHRHADPANIHKEIDIALRADISPART